LLSVLVGVISTASYALSVPAAIRQINPGLGAWWDLNQFYFMEGAATALGLLVGIRIGRSFVSDTAAKARGANVALVLAIIVLIPLMHLCAGAARIAGGGHTVAIQGVTIANIRIARKPLDKVLTTGVYFFKMAGFAGLAGLALFAVAAVAFLGSGKSSEEQTAGALMFGDVTASPARNNETERCN
jgi:uncharacterized membrane protein YedE/YeeE